MGMYPVGLSRGKYPHSKKTHELDNQVAGETNTKVSLFAVNNALSRPLSISSHKPYHG